MNNHTHNGLDSNKVSVNGVYEGDDALKLSTAQTVADVKTFTSIPIIPETPTADNQMSSKKYADDLDIPTFEIIASDILIDSLDDEVVANSSTIPLKKKELEYNEIDGTIRVKFDLKNPNSFSDGSHGRIYINGVAVGTEQTTGSDTYETFTEDIDVENGDLVQLYIWNTSSDTKPTYAQNFRLYYSKRLTNITAGTINLN